MEQDGAGEVFGMQVLNLGEPRAEGPSARAEPEGGERRGCLGFCTKGGLAEQFLDGDTQRRRRKRENQPEVVAQGDARWSCCAGRKAGIRGPSVPLNLGEKQSSGTNNPPRSAALDDSTASGLCVHGGGLEASSKQGGPSTHLVPPGLSGAGGAWLEAAKAPEPGLSSCPSAEPPVQRQCLVRVQHSGLQTPRARGGGGGTGG